MNSTLKQQAARDIAGHERPAISPTVADVDEIERFLREEFQAPGAEKAPEHTDPLMAELARIVGQEVRPVAPTPPAMPQAHDPFAVTAAPGSASDPLRAFEEELRRFDAVNRRPVQEPEVAAVLGAIPQAAPVQAAPVYPGDFRAIEPVAPVPSAPVPDLDFALLPQDQPGRMPAPDALEPQGIVAEDLAPVPPVAPRSRRVLYLLGGAAAFAVIGVIGSVAFSNKKPAGSTVPVIAAKTQPAKEKPADPGGVEVPGQDRQVLARKTDEPVRPASVVTKEEQPVDLSQTPKREVSRVILAQPTQQGAASATPAAPIIMPPGAAQPTPDAAQPGQPVTAGGFEAKRVRSVKIGGDGALASNPAAAAAPVPAPRPSTPTLAAAPPVASTVPKVEAPKAETAKSDARPVTAARQPARVATPAPAPAVAEGTDAPMSLRPPAAGTTRPVRTATATPAPAERTAPDAKSGGFAVQLAAPGSESEARSTASRLKQRYSDALDGHTPGVRKADVGGRTVYRVRVGGLSRQDANELCTRIKGDGGSCFVASN